MICFRWLFLLNFSQLNVALLKEMKTEDNAREREEGFEDVGSSSLLLDPFSPQSKEEKSTRNEKNFWN